MAVAKITVVRGSVDRVPQGMQPKLELDLDEGQTVLGIKWREHVLVHSERRTHDWYYEATLVTYA